MQIGSPTKDYFYRLDTLRFIAFFLVFANHITNFLKFPASVGTQGTAPFTYLQVGDLGVGFFFVLSGFLITYLLEKERERTGTISLKNFYIRRVLRIWPLYFLALILIVLISYIFHGFNLYKIDLDLHEIFANIFFVGNYFKAFHYTANEMVAVLWSIAVEEQFYIFWPLIFLFGRKWISWILGLGVLISMAYRYHYANDFPVREFYTFTVMVYLLVGSYAGIYGAKIRNWIKKNHIWLIVSSSILFLGLLSIRGFVFDYAYPKWFIALDGLLFAIFFAMIILSAAFGGKGKTKSIFGRTTEYLGTISYGLYIYHLVALTVVLNVLDKFGLSYQNLEGIRFSIIAVSAFGLVVLVSSVSYSYYEKPFLKLKEKFITKS